MCSTNNPSFYYKDKKREYWRCTSCELIFVPQSFHLTADAEKAIYDLHINNSSDVGYRQFLQRFVSPLIDHLPNPRIFTKNQLSILDFGCGPGPTLSLMLQELGFSCENYDIYYANHPELLKPYYYDVITSTEVVEHLSEPYSVFKCMFSLLKPKATLAVMTKRSDTLERFKNWHYIQDPTHICFYNKVTFTWIAQQFKAHVTFPENDVAIFHKLL